MVVVRSPSRRDFHPYPSRKKMPRHTSRHFLSAPLRERPLFHHFQARPATRARWLGIRWRQVIAAFVFDRFVILERRLQIEHHALAVLPGIDAEDGANRHEQRMRTPPKRPSKLTASLSMCRWRTALGDTFSTICPSLAKPSGT
ncbi:hypothetical protein Ddc_23701 [Ditylenchus destructor]|nr:hypothetical protein Ddc_23701 [Ditylenchus destructor]